MYWNNKGIMNILNTAVGLRYIRKESIGFVNYDVLRKL